VTVYTQFGYAMVDLDKYREAQPSQQPEAESPEKPKGPEQQMVDSHHDSGNSTTSLASAGSGSGDKIIEVQYKWGFGYI
jgi:hypothetical protein